METLEKPRKILGKFIDWHRFFYVIIMCKAKFAPLGLLCLFMAFFFAIPQLAVAQTVSVSIPAPVLGEEPETSITGSDFSTGTINWTPPVPSTDRFEAEKEYTAFVTLTANTPGDFTGKTLDADCSVTNDTNDGDIITFECEFTATGSKEVDGISAAAGSMKINYEYNEELNLTGLVVTITYNDFTTEAALPSDITTSITDGTKLTTLGTNTITVTHTPSSETATIDVTVVTKKITKPGLVNSQFTYNGDPQTVELDPEAENDEYDFTGGQTQTNANDNYTAVVELKDKTNYEWVGGGTTDLSLPWEILKATPVCSGLTLSATDDETLDDMQPNDLLCKGLSNSDLAGTFSWNEAGTTSVGSVGPNTHLATFTPDNTNYNEVNNVSITINVASSGPPPTGVIDFAETDGTYGTLYDQAVEVTGFSGTSYAWSISSGALPNGLTLNALNGSASTTTISGTPTSAGTFDFTIKVVVDSDDNLKAEQPFTIVINPKGIAEPVLAAGPPFTYDGNPKAVILNPEEPAIYDFVSGDTATNAGSYTAIVALSSTTNYKWNTQGNSNNLSLPWSISKADPICSPSNLSAKEGQKLSNVPIGLTACGLASGSFAWVDGTLDVGNDGDTPSFNAKFTSTNNNYNDTTVSITIEVGPPSLTLITITGNNGTYDSLFSETLEATGAFTGTSYDWSISEDNFPGGLTLESGNDPTITISGTPTSAGSFTFKINVVDDDNIEAEEVFTIAVAKKQITSVAVTGVVAPKTDSIPSSAGTTASTEYSVTNVSWDPTDNPFLGGTVYSAIVTLTADGNYTFTGGFTLGSSVTNAINGIAATVEANSGSTLTLKAPFPATSSASTLPSSSSDEASSSSGISSSSSDGVSSSSGISSSSSDEASSSSGISSSSSDDASSSSIVVEITTAAITITPPVPGAEPDTVATGMGEFTINPVGWTPADATFVFNEQYTATVKLTANNGYTFANSFAATINSQPATILGNTGTEVNLSYQFPIVTEVPITTAAIMVTTPATGKAPNVTATTTGKVNFIPGDVTWFPDVNPFLGGTEYEATVTLTANAGYTFIGLTTPTINGRVANIEENLGETVTISYKFPPTSTTQSTVVTAIEVTEQPIKLTYMHDDPLDLSGMEVTLTYSDKKTEKVAFANFAARKITTNPANGAKLSNSIHNNSRIEVTYTYNNTILRARTDVLLVSKKITPTIAIEGIPLKSVSPDGKEFTYVSSCGENSIEIDISAKGAEIVVDGNSSEPDKYTLVKDLSYEGDTVGITISDASAMERYTLNVKKPFPWEKMITILWGNTLVVNGNPKETDHNYEFSNYKWYRNGREVGSGRSWSAGTNGEKLNPNDNYHVEATTKEGKIINSCNVDVPTKTVAQQKYGILLKNNSAYSNIGIEIFAPEESSEVEITVHDIAGKQVFKQIGNYALNWNLTDAMQKSVPNGLYFVTAKVKGESGKLYRYSAKLVVKR
jgi:hypothetical protein